jgi:protein-disulfide isomerase
MKLKLKLKLKKKKKKKQKKKKKKQKKQKKTKMEQRLELAHQLLADGSEGGAKLGTTVTPTLVRGVGDGRVDDTGGLGVAVIRRLGGAGSEELGAAVAAFQRAKKHEREPRGGPVPAAVSEGLE